MSFFFSDALNPGYVFVNISVDSDISSHEVSYLDPLEFVFADHGSDGHLLPEIVQRERQREMVRSCHRSPLVPNMDELCPGVACWIMKTAPDQGTGSFGSS